MGSKKKLYAEHESDFPCFDNLTITDSVNADDEEHELILDSFNNDNHTKEIEKHIHPLLTNDNNYSLTEICSSTNVNVEQRVSRSTNKFSDFLTMYRHDYNEEVLNNQQNNNIINNSITSTTTTTMSNKNFVLTFDHEQLQSTSLLSSSASESLLSPAEQPFGRRYAEISQFISHPNVEWTTDDKPQQQQPDTVDQSFYDDVDVEKKETVMASCIQKSDDDEDLQMLLNNDNLSKDNFFESNVESSDSDGGAMAEGEDETSSSDSQISGDSPSPSCDLGLMERLLRTHPVWFLPGLQRGGSVHLLQGKEVGNFIVRGSSQKNTMAISVRLPRDCGPYIEHYLVQSNNGLLNLESSRFKFDSIPALICHYAQCCDELPVQLCLPKGLREAINRQQLMSLALLGSEFWRCPLTSDTRFSPGDDESLMKSPTDTSGISTMEMSSLTKKNNSFFNKFNKTSNSNNNQQLVETPSDTASSMSSFVVSGGQSQLLSPQSADNVFINSPSADFCNLKSNSKSISNLNSPSGIIGKTSTFKTQKFSASHKMLQSPEFNSILTDYHHPQTSTSNAINHSEFNPDELIRPPRPTPPCTLNLALAPISRAPAPPKRWSKSSDPKNSNSPYVEQRTQQSNNNFVVTTTVTFNVNKQQHHTAEMEIPPRNNVVPTISERLSPEGGECKTNSDSSLQKWEQLKSPTNPFKPNESVRSKRSSNRRKQSKHYHDSDILESPSVYCRSNLGDKISDYEDLWDPEKNNNNTGSNAFISMDTNTSNSSCNEVLSPMVISSPRQVTPPPFGSEIAITTNSPMQPKMFVDNNRSPFYSNPVDAVTLVTASNHSTINPIVRREPKLTILPSFHRYSEPPKGQFEDLHFHASPNESEREIHQQLAAGSLDQLKSTHKPASGRTMDPIWTVDSSWEFLDKNEDSSENISIKNTKQLTPKLPSVKYPTSFQNTLERRNRALNMNALAQNKSSTVYKLISKKYPEIALNDAGGSCWQTFENEPKFQRLSSYDNVEQLSIYAASFAQSDDGTLFSEPWDSSQWDSFLPTTDDSSTIHLSKCRPAISEDETLMEDSSLISKNTLQRNQLPNSYKVATILRNRSSSYKDREILQHPRNKYLQNVGNSVEAYTMELAQDSSSTFSKNIDNFICCTKESREVEPQKVMRNMRQFMNGMKNYLVKHGEKDFAMVVQKARLHLKDDEFLNLDHVLEGVMHRLIILPLREHLYTLLVDFYHQTNEIKTIINGIRTAEDKDPQFFGIGEGISPPSSTTLARISSILLSLQEAELPTEKMQLMMNAVDAILDTSKAAKTNARHLGADDFLPLLVYSVAKCGFISAEIEAEYMWGLLHPSLLTGEVGYYVTTICSAIAVIKTFTDGNNSEGGTLNPNVPLECSVLRIIIPDEYNGSIQTKTIPVRPHTTTKDVCRIIAHKGHITNPQDYGLFKLVDGEETLLMEHDCPQEARINTGGKHCILAYKRIDAKIAWPTSK